MIKTTGEQSNKITVELTEYEAQCFVEYQKYRELFNHLVTSKVFDIRGGKAILHFDNDGSLFRIGMDITSYQKGTPHVYIFKQI